MTKEELEQEMQSTLNAQQSIVDMLKQQMTNFHIQVLGNCALTGDYVFCMKEDVANRIKTSRMRTKKGHELRTKIIEIVEVSGFQRSNRKDGFGRNVLVYRSDDSPIVILFEKPAKTEKTKYFSPHLAAVMNGELWSSTLLFNNMYIQLVYLPRQSKIHKQHLARWSSNANNVEEQLKAVREEQAEMVETQEDESFTNDDHWNQWL